MWTFSTTSSGGGRPYVAGATGGGKVTSNDLIGQDRRFQSLKNISLGGTLNVFGLFDRCDAYS